MTNIQYRAIGRKRGTEEWNVITWGGEFFYATQQMINDLLAQMQAAFPQNEYLSEPHDFSRT